MVHARENLPGTESCPRGYTLQFYLLVSVCTYKLRKGLAFQKENKKFILMYSFGHFLKMSKWSEHSLPNILHILHITHGYKVAFE